MGLRRRIKSDKSDACAKYFEANITFILGITKHVAVVPLGPRKTVNFENLHNHLFARSDSL